MTSAEFRDKNPDFAHTNDSTVVIKEIAPGVRLFIDLSDHVIGLNILRGQYEQDEIALRAPHAEARRHRGRRRRAHRVLHHADGGDGRAGRARVYAFEPFDANADLLERSIAENGSPIASRFQRAAVGAAAGTATLTFPVETLNSGGAYLLRDGTAPLAGQSEEGRAGRRAGRAGRSGGRCGSSRWTSKARSRRSSAARSGCCARIGR